MKNEVTQSISCTNEAIIEGIPIELWRLILSYLPPTDLARCCVVCQVFYELVVSLDSTVWKKCFLSETQWRHPSWPKSTDDPTTPWRILYGHHYKAARSWSRGSVTQNQASASCSTILTKTRLSRKFIYVGPDRQFRTVKSALFGLNAFDCILLDPGKYKQPFEITSKIPCELRGNGPTESVVLVMSAEHFSGSARLCNLVLRAPFSNVLKLTGGHLQLDNCVMEDGMVTIQSPATSAFRYCTFRKVKVRMQNVFASVLENCLFEGNENEVVLVLDGAPIAEKGQNSRDLCQLLGQTESMTPTEKADVKPGKSRHSSSALSSAMESSLYSDDVISMSTTAGAHYHLATAWFDVLDSSVANTDESDPEAKLEPGNHDDDAKEASDEDDVLRMSYSGWRRQQPVNSIMQLQPEIDVQISVGKLHDFESLLRHDPVVRSYMEEIRGCYVKNCLFQNNFGGIDVCRQAHAQIVLCEFKDLHYGLRCIQNCRVAILQNSIHNCLTSGIYMRYSGQGVIAGNDIYCHNEAAIDIRRHADPLVQCNRIHHGKRSGVVVLGSGRGTIRANEIYCNKEAGVYVLSRGNPHICENRICRGQAAGIAVNAEGRGYIVDNMISGNSWGGIDIRHGGDPIVIRNLITNGAADGVVVGDNGFGRIEGNIIKGNGGCGVWVMGGYCSLQSNQIHGNRDAGVAFVRPGERRPLSSESRADNNPSADFLISNIHRSKTTPKEADKKIEIQYNSLYYNNGPGISLDHSEEIALHSNVVHANRDSGIIVRQNANVSITNCSITSNDGSGLHIFPQAQVSCTDTGIFDNFGHGVLTEGKICLENNDIISNQLCAVNATNFCQVQNNRLFSMLDHAVSGPGFANSIVKDNVIYRGVQKPVFSAENEDFLLSNTVTEHPSNIGESSSGLNWLQNPSARPNISLFPAVAPEVPERRVLSMTTIVVPQATRCNVLGSKSCVLL